MNVRVLAAGGVVCRSNVREFGRLLMQGQQRLICYVGMRRLLTARVQDAVLGDVRDIPFLLAIVLCNKY
jgi:hypothetical protein